MAEGAGPSMRCRNKLFFLQLSSLCDLADLFDVGFGFLFGASVLAQVLMSCLQFSKCVMWENVRVCDREVDYRYYVSRIFRVIATRFDNVCAPDDLKKQKQNKKKSFHFLLPAVFLKFLTTNNI